MNATAAPLETPSGKDRDYENFPVGSWLLQKKLRPHVFTYYQFARAIDDIADNPDLAADEKIARLQVFSNVLCGSITDASLKTATNMRNSLLETGVSFDHCLDLIRAFKQDAVKNRYDNWGQLMDYCLLSAAPVGRYLIDLHGGTKNGYGASDALCSALQVINHLQDCKEDYMTMDRVYLPLEWMENHGAVVDDLKRDQTPQALRGVFDQILTATEKLMAETGATITDIKDRRLAMESGAIIKIAYRLIRHLQTRDPLAEKVKLGKFDYFSCCLLGAMGTLIKR